MKSILKQILKEAVELDDEKADVAEEVELNEISGQDGLNPISHPKTRNRTNKAPEYYIAVDQYKIAIPDYDSKFVMQNLQFTHGVTTSDFNRAFKTVVFKKAIELMFKVIKRYPTYNVVLMRDRWSYAPVSFGGSQQRRPGVIDCWVHGSNGMPGFWNNGAKYLKLIDNTIDYYSVLNDSEETSECEDSQIHEAFDHDSVDYIRLYDFQHFIENVSNILTEFGSYGFLVLRDKSNLYGFMFKGVGAEEGREILKCHMYRYPQVGLIHGGQTFFSTLEDIKAAIVKALATIK